MIEIIKEFSNDKPIYIDKTRIETVEKAYSEGVEYTKIVTYSGRVVAAKLLVNEILELITKEDIKE